MGANPEDPEDPEKVGPTPTQPEEVNQKPETWSNIMEDAKEEKTAMKEALDDKPAAVDGFKDDIEAQLERMGAGGDPEDNKAKIELQKPEDEADRMELNDDKKDVLNANTEAILLSTSQEPLGNDLKVEGKQEIVDEKINGAKMEANEAMEVAKLEVAPNATTLDGTTTYVQYARGDAKTPLQVSAQIIIDTRQVLSMIFQA